MTDVRMPVLHINAKKYDGEKCHSNQMFLSNLEIRFQTLGLKVIWPKTCI